MNAKQEFIDHTTDKSKVSCAFIRTGNSWDNIPESKFILKQGYTEEQLNAFLESLNFEYDDGFGGQNLYGTIWYIDGTWSSRGEYDGSEWWEHHEVPDIPEECL